MPIYLYECERCQKEAEVIQVIPGKAPLCCGASMNRLPTSPAKIQIKAKGGVKIHSKGYKEGYSREYLKRLEEAKT